MTNEEKILQMQKEVHDIGRDMRAIGSKVDEVLIALKGSPLTGDGGLIGRITYLEAQIEAAERKFDIEVGKIKEANAKSAVYQNILWTCAGAIATGVGLYIIKTILK